MKGRQSMKSANLDRIGLKASDCCNLAAEIAL